jgi:hypothetical protein
MDLEDFQSSAAEPLTTKMRDRRTAHAKGTLPVYKNWLALLIASNHFDKWALGN